MNVSAGSRLGPYEIVSRLGAGGMGEVWSAIDTRLDRRVAVKILPTELSADSRFRLRFEREAKTISQLSHPNICTLFDIGDDFLVMELLEGETLADRIARGPLPIADVLRYGVQIAEALGKAHRMGIVHRDLKPANIMITKAGAKLLDFGLAKSAASVVNVDGATQQKGLTQEGTILGTFQYMAPEQLEGQEADARTDIFAFGAVLYEMATGQRAFEGKTRTSLIAQIVSAEPKPLHDLQPLTPPAFEHIVSRCLRKDPDERWQSAQDIAEDLRFAASAVPTAAALPPRTAWWPWAVAAAISLAAVAAVLFVLKSRPAPRVVWSSIAAPRGVRMLGVNDRGGTAIAPDGARVAFIGQDIGQGKDPVRRLYIRDLGTGDVRPLSGTEGAAMPFWSPDSKSVAFFAEGKLNRIDADGTRLARVVDEVDGRGGTWSADGTIVFAPSSTSGLARVKATGGKAEPLTSPSGDQNSHRFPSFLPDGKHFFYVAQGSRDRGVFLGSTDGKVSRKILDVSASAVFSAGAVVFVRDRSLYAQRLDLRSMTLEGEPQQLAANVTTRDSSFSHSGLSASTAGDILFPETVVSQSVLAWRDRKGAVLQSLPQERNFSEPVFGPDEKRALMTSDEPPDSLWEVDLERGRSRRVTLGEGAGPVTSPLWSRDGNRILITTTSGGKPVIASIPPAGGALRTIASGTLYGDTFHPREPILVADGPGPGARNFDIFEVNLADGRTRPMIAGAGNELRAQFSPDGSLIAYTSDETGRAEIFVQTWPPGQGKWQVTFAGGDQAAWSGDGKELFCLAPDGKLMSVAVQPGPAFGDPTVLFQTALTLVSLTGNRNQYLPARDGQRFLVVEESTLGSASVTFIANFRQLLENGR